MNAPIEIFNKRLLKTHLNRANRDDFLVREAREMLEDKLSDIKRDFSAELNINRFYEILEGGENKYDIIKSSLELHWINDLPGVLLQSKRLLKPDGLFIANIFGGETLKELRECFYEAEPEGISPRISPFVDVRDAGSLLQRAGFALPVVDSDTIIVTYEDAFHLMRHLRKIGETNALIKQRKNFTCKSFMDKVVEIYAKKFTDNEGRIEASFEIVTMTAWKPHASQQQPLARGSAKNKLEDALS
ncbi:MAG: SAM-dependent methyltransferase [Alphaproteobacteria bacterium CG11_big_fil_rev_8_21_14_0_20_44_7]|nr:MAG: SAM-dependent methyltransferase [Alphaproteobacteria bacterium CG11_big_fil_rev_8_21_14_0_20_44_7]